MYPKLTDLKKYQNQYSYVPVAISFTVDDFSAIKLIAHLAQQKEMAYFSGGNHALGKFSYFVRPTFSLKLLDGEMTVSSQQQQRQFQVADPQGYLTELLAKYRQPLFSKLPPFAGGLIGYFAYEYSQYYQKHLKFHQQDLAKLPDLNLFGCLNVLAFDHTKRQLMIIQNIATADLENNYQTAELNLKKQGQQLKASLRQPLDLPSFELTDDFKMRFSPVSYAAKVKAAQKQIVKGEIFQLIMSNPQTGKMRGSLLPILQQLLVAEPAAYHFYFKQADFCAVAASPETLVTKDRQELAGYPLAGTRKLTGDRLKDQRRIKELTTSQKELAEHNMLVDLGRNDLGQVSRFGTVKVVQHAYLEKFETVVHLASTIKSQVDPTKSLLDILAAVFPAGTLSGAPKLRAIQIIDELEQQKRGLYGGTFGYLSFSGQMDLAIGIRLLYQIGQQLCLQTGAGIVADSCADHEYQECCNKARSMKLAVQAVLQKEAANGTFN
ncbi:anthranilate synthase component I family protein [Liquorilactobacillus sicerae]|uniref:anthranilate synthase component I family protein n=1 Tax=Liquorilactobacillus sicerae TaxID=1416943 RepID=UPI00248087AA|nr:anthranilate synthase component I family protein [Liquorilactobacillus sicerae]